MKSLPSFVLAVSSLVLSACGPNGSLLSPGSIEYVRHIIGDPDCPEQLVLKSYDPLECDADIFVIGDTLSCAEVSDALVRCDERNNIDGNDGEDFLPDYAGENLSVLNDMSNGSYDSLILAGKTYLLRELTLRNVIKAMDTLCFKSPFDMDGLGRKAKAKMIVLASPCVAAYGYSDVDSLLATVGCTIPVVSPMNVLSAMIVDGNNSKIGVITSELRAQNGIYQKIFADAAAAKGRKVECVVSSVEDHKNALTSFLDSHIDSCSVEPFDVIVVDDPQCDINAMHEELVRIMSVMNEEYLKYSEHVSPGLAFVTSVDAVNSECYTVLRARNLFTHRISYPTQEPYMIIRRTPDGGLDSNILVEYNSRYIPE